MPSTGHSQSGKNRRNITGAMTKAKSTPIRNPTAAAKSANAAEIKIQTEPCNISHSSRKLLSIETERAVAGFLSVDVSLF